MSTAQIGNKKNIEIEFRAQFSKKKYGELSRFLVKHARNLGVNDQRIWFFVLPDKLLKVTHNITSQSGKITLKLTKIGKGNHFEEIEFFISEDAILPAIKIFAKLGYRYLFEPKILRHNFSYKGVELALKYSKTWGYHLELEVLIGSLKEKAGAEEKIQRVADELGVKIMSEKELLNFSQHTEKTYVNPKNSEKMK